jgi:hypothetical protein
VPGLTVIFLVRVYAGDVGTKNKQWALSRNDKKKNKKTKQKSAPAAHRAPAGQQALLGTS